MGGGFCPACGYEHGDVKFCPECGTEVGRSESSESAVNRGSEPDDGSVERDGSDEDGGLNITLGKIVGYLVGPLLILVSLGAMGGGDVIAGVLILLAGFLALPVVRAKIAAQQGLTLSRWATVAIVLVLVMAGGFLMDTNDTTGTEPVGADGVEDADQALIDKPATDLVIQLNQLGSGWTQVEHDGNDTHAVGEYFHSGDSAFLGTTVDRYETVEEAAAEYESRVEEVQERHGNDVVDVGDEAILYSISDSVWVIFRDDNVVAEVQYDEEFAFDPEETAEEFAVMMQENFRG